MIFEPITYNVLKQPKKEKRYDDGVFEPITYNVLKLFCKKIIFFFPNIEPITYNVLKHHSDSHLLQQNF